MAAGALMALALVVIGASGCKKGGSNADGGDGPPGDAGQNVDGRTDGRDGPDGPPCVKMTKAMGAACGCGLECASGFCADGVCCKEACTEGCKTCNATGTAGTCVSRATGEAPREQSACAKAPESSCGLDGKCDGQGACRKWPAGTMCKAGMCDGAAVVGANVCDGAGHCRPGSTRICVPFSCDPTTGDCYKKCSTNSQCVSGQECKSESCGKLMGGSTCDRNDQCASEFCADHICCNVACQGACLACNLPGRVGICWPVDADDPDPRGICRDQGAATCGQNGKCDGIGSCLKYARDTQCVAPTCAGNRLNTAGTCNGLGTCQPPGLLDCKPYRCATVAGVGACVKSCTSNTDCDTGIACVAGMCGPKQDGQSCTTASECQHGNCVDGVCCDTACVGACRSCALTATMGKCTPVAANTTDPRRLCPTMAQSTCGTNGKCDGNNACQIWPVGTLCGDETCNPTGNVYKAPSLCNAGGQCEAPDLQPCSPYICNGPRCFTACTNNSHCVPPFSCANNMCGLKENGAACSLGTECRSTICAQGVCCDTACNTSCKSCIAGVRGVCSNVAKDSPDPAGLCPTTDASTCGTNGKCEGGACQKWPASTPCMPAACPATTNAVTPLSTCDGAGTCNTPATSSCFPYRCGTGACKASCTADADCLPPAVCAGGQCGLKPNGALCAGKDECLSGNCEQSVCCETTCTGVCKSCALTASRGVCSNIPNGTVDILSRCSDQGAVSCGTDGFCNGQGACRLYNASTPCAPPSCPANGSTLTSGRTCNGSGVCQAAQQIACAPYMCNGTTACLAACTRDADCQSPNICDPQTSRCGNKKRLGQACASTNDCLTGNFCVDGVCCSVSSCALCKSCNVGTSAGNCANTPVGVQETMGRCTPNPPCGNTGACNGAGACALAATTTSCGTAMCSGSTYTLTSTCNGMGACSTPTSGSCSPYLCSGTACRTTCSMDSHCLSPFTCQGTAPNRSCSLKANGLTCTAGNQCISGNCVNGVCCGKAACGTCETCMGTMPGTCTPLAAGTAAPAGQCAANPPCGNTGTCNGASGCTQAAATVACGLALSCSGTALQPASTCTGSGTCNQIPATTCGNYVCASTTACRTNCNTDAHCASTSLYCTGTSTTAGSCVPKKANGAACSAVNECATGNCVNGVCCGSPSCGTCQTCNGTMPGTCTPLAAGTAAPAGQCAASPPCGNTGTCNGAGACTQASASTACGLPLSCSGTALQPASTCNGSGACNQIPATTCGNYVCASSTACRTSCNSDAHCANTDLYCTGNATTAGSCVAKKGNGTACAAGNECTSGSCVDSVCCAAGSCPTCQACNLNGSGTCAPVASGPEPHSRCTPNPPCGNTGACTNGACTQQPASTSCGLAESCTGTTHQPPSTCSGSGSCVQTSPQSCGAYLCNTNNTCRTTCAGDGDCANSNYYCAGGTCTAKRALGDQCTADNQCGSGNCVDSVCCMTGSCATCWACNLNGAGTCAPVASGPEPHSLCTPSPPCGNTGSCTNGACTQGAAGLMCSGFGCASATTYQRAGTCNGAGGCSIPPVQDCAPLTCQIGSGCRLTCSDDSHCANPNDYCDSSGSCVPRKGLGAACGGNNECTSTHCTEGVCCNLAQCLSCQSCKIALSVGTCTNVAAGDPDPQLMCVDQTPASCGTNGRCNGAGNCQRYDISTECALTCDGTNVTHTFCDVVGTCNGLSIVDLCPSLMCNANGCVPLL